MLFNSSTFALFFLIVYALYALLRRNYRRQNWLLFVASYVFYGWWDVRFLFLIVLATYIDYCMSLLIDTQRLTTRQQVKSGLYLVLSALGFVTISWNRWLPLGDTAWFSLPATLSGWWCTGLAVLVVGMVAIAAKIVAVSQVDKARKWCVFLSVLINLGILGIFKYFNFFVESFVTLWSRIFQTEPSQVTLHIILPVGISFFTFQTMSHTIDVYRKKMSSNNSLLELATYVAFFPQLVAGPIERGAHLLPQFQRARSVTLNQFYEGLWLIFWGLYKKVVVADNIAKIVNEVFGPYDSLSISTLPQSGWVCLIAVYGFALQIYGDFSGYTDMARGTAKLMGFDIMLNFNLPYFAVNPSDFWRRWHISLSSWLRDYLYIPLGGNRKGPSRTYVNLFLTMLLGGLWHGAAWTFVLWGAFHGLILIVYRLLKQETIETCFNVKNIVKALIMFHLVCFGWLLFRAQNLETVRIFVTAIGTRMGCLGEALSLGKDLLYYSWFLIVFQIIQARKKDLLFPVHIHWFLGLNLWIFVAVSIVRLAQINSNEFIYFAF